jgi:hypothetical protein
MNSALVQFTDNRQREVVSRNALRVVREQEIVMLRLYVASILLERNLRGRYALKHVARYIVDEREWEEVEDHLRGSYVGKWTVRDIDLLDITSPATHMVSVNERHGSVDPEVEVGEAPDCEQCRLLTDETWRLADRVALRDLTKRIAGVELLLSGKGPR